MMKENAVCFDDRTLIEMLRHCGHMLRHMPVGGDSRFRTLELLSDGRAHSQRELQEALGLQSGSVSELMGKIESDGLIERETLASDRRGLAVRLSDRGRTILDERRPNEEGALLRCLSEEEKNALGVLLSRLLSDWRASMPHREGRRPPRDERMHDDRAHGGHPHRERQHGGAPFDGERPRHGGPQERRLQGEFVPLDAKPRQEGCIGNCRACDLRKEGKCVYERV